MKRIRALWGRHCIAIRLHHLFQKQFRIQEFTASQSSIAHVNLLFALFCALATYDLPKKRLGS
jgi:hypothetical protein